VLRWPLIVLGSLIGLACLWMGVGPTVRGWQVERQIAHFERHPSQARADSLVELLESHAATVEQGQRILTLLRRPSVTTRSAYPTGHPIMVGLEQPFRLDFRDAPRWREEVRVVEGGYRSTNSGRFRTLHVRGPHAFQAEPGNHQFTVQCTYSVEIQRRSGLANVEGHLRRLLGAIQLSLPTIWQPSLTYECEFKMPVQVTVVPKEEAKAIELVSSPELDQAMRNAFRLQQPNIGRSRRTVSGRVRSIIFKRIRYQDLPLPVAFRLAVHLSDGQELTTSLENPKTLVAGTGASGRRSFHCWFEKPGTYTGTVVLHPDPNCAYEHPTIETIWNGTVELPISFKVPAEPNSP